MHPTKIFTAAILVLCLTANSWAATRTASVSGNASNAATFGGSALSNGDIVVVNTGITLTFDADYSLGSNASGIGDALTVNATDQNTFGKVVVNDGVVLTLKGFGTSSNRAALISRYAVLEPAPGATIRVDCASDYQTIIDNRGIINAIGTAPKPIIFDSPAANVTWSNAVASEAFSGQWKFDSANSIACAALTNWWVANSGGTGPGTFGDSSVSFTLQSPATILQTPVASLAAVTSAGKYYVDHDLGVIYFYHVAAAGNPTFTTAYKYLTVPKGWGIKSAQNNTYNEAKFNYCTFKYMGSATSSDNRSLDVQNKQSAAVAANRLFYLKNSTVAYCHKILGFTSCTGTLADPLLVDGNTIGPCGSETNLYGPMITMFRTATTYVSITNNTISCRQPFIYTTQFGPPLDHTGWKVNDNTGTCAAALVSGQSLLTRFPDTEIKRNTINGVGSAVDGRTIDGVGGTSGHVVTVADNTFTRVMRGITFNSYFVAERNILDRVYHHGIFAPVEDNVKLTNIRIRNNLSIGEHATAYDSGFIELGYNHHQWIDDIQVVNNTLVGNATGAVNLGDTLDNGHYVTCTRAVVANNLAKMNTAGTSKAWQRRADSTTSVWRGHVLRYDYNLDHNYNTRYTNINRQGTFTQGGGASYGEVPSPDRNVTGVSLFSPNFSTATGKTVDFVYTSATDQTLAFDGGTPVQLVLNSGTATSGTITTSNGALGVWNGTLTDSGKSFSTTKNNAACPINHFLKITGGTGAGYIGVITDNTATVLTCVPAFSVAPDTSTTYIILKTEVQLVDGADTVQAGIYWPDMPTTTGTDNGIDFADHSVTGSDPLLVNAAGTTAADYKWSSSSPAKNVGDKPLSGYYITNDYFGTTRPVGATVDIGFFEFPTTSTQGPRNRMKTNGGLRRPARDLLHRGAWSDRKTLALAA